MADKTVAEQLDEIEERVMNGLKDFQKATVERIAHLFDRDRKPVVTRVLVSDEVGLGKTLIARGTIAKFAQIRKKENDPLVKVVYVCSNSAIADQNMRKLQIDQRIDKQDASSSRLSMQHLKIFQQENDTKIKNSYIQLIPLTPDTSFRITNSMGTADERALMYVILSKMKEFEGKEIYLKDILKGYKGESWHWLIEKYEDAVNQCDEITIKNNPDDVNAQYVHYMTEELREHLLQPFTKEVSFFDAILKLCEDVKNREATSQQKSEIVKKLRHIFAQISIDRLEPDLIIMDEFQRFKYLMDSDAETEESMLANKFFNTKDVRILLLSATPYKMYSTLEEIDEAHADEHYTEFLNVMQFLNSKEEYNEFATVWENYSVKLRELAKGDTAIIEIKNQAEDALYKHICRTERILANIDFVDTSDVKVPVKVTEDDIRSFTQAQKLLSGLVPPLKMPVDYIKSCPYLLSFMQHYKLRDKLEDYFGKHLEQVGRLNGKTFWLKKEDINRYKQIPYSNARLVRTANHVFKDNAELLLWVPPSLPYYKGEGAFKDIENFSKTLIFSSWEMVPRMLASMLSYEAERKVKKEFPAYDNSDRRSKISEKLGFNKRNKSATNLFALLYPCEYLTEIYNPLEHLSADLESIKAQLKEKISISFDYDKTAEPDTRWYYIAPLLLDDKKRVEEWFQNASLILSDNEDSAKESEKKTFCAAINDLKILYNKIIVEKSELLGNIPADLVDVLVDIALASPAVVINRTYKLYSKTEEVKSYLPSQIAMLFLKKMRSPESVAVIRTACKNEAEDWRKLLTYCVHGNLQAVFDEYAHIIANGLDANKSLYEKIHSSLSETILLQTTTYNIDTYESFVASLKKEKNSEHMISMRSHFAVAFSKGSGDEKSGDRKKMLRGAFNSPFRPFVLASTSIGQEGLDFHNYCRRIVHWNLPSNPIDLEQREGRINRFECLAIRQNIAKRYGNFETTQFKDNAWKEMLVSAKDNETQDGCSELIPFWGLTPQKNMIKIERIVPMYPFSKDNIAYERLIKILSLYRLTLGQARQEELLEYILQSNPDEDQLKNIFINLSPYFKK